MKLIVIRQQVTTRMTIPNELQDRKKNKYYYCQGMHYFHVIQLCKGENSLKDAFDKETEAFYSSLLKGEKGEYITTICQKNNFL